ncbi:hypothetical protein [Ideonella sp. A 288]|uniref:hypothetical protein n=1 Tax=Ideonella sp. A 288 TaxID=1962181 RepID=UPI001184B8FC|nr:hypothetical protein [Ideonella sp. A 288]
MFDSLLKLIPGRSKPEAAAADAVFQVDPLATLVLPGAEPFDFAATLQVVQGLPVPDWTEVRAWVGSLPDPAAQAEAWARAELAWLAHLQAALGPQVHVARHQHALLLSSLEPRVAAATVQFMTKTLARIEKVLEGVARAPQWGSDILLVFDDPETYYRYVSRYYPDDGEFAFSGGMHIHFGCGHFATFAAELHAIEPVIAHEMTHACVAHLAIPAWLNEGLAVNTERRLCPPGAPQHTPQQLHWMHQHFWTADRIQEFWEGRSFLRADEGNLLSYDLARILTEQFAADWLHFKAFVHGAAVEDAGRAAAEQAFGVDLGKTVCALFGFDASDDWSPRPQCWQGQPERGAFSLAHGRLGPGLALSSPARPPGLTQPPAQASLSCSLTSSSAPTTSSARSPSTRR